MDVLTQVKKYRKTNIVSGNPCIRILVGEFLCKRGSALAEYYLPACNRVNILGHGRNTNQHKAD
jgi:hypothetical protein